MEHAKLEAAIWLLRSGAESDRAKQADGPAGNTAICGGVCVVSRDAACEASHEALRLFAGFTLAGISRGRKTLRSLYDCAEIPGSPGALASFFFLIDFLVELFDFFADFVAVFSLWVEIEIALIGF